jgi:predicted RNA binding protein YcfA (HicA-like mRNA interferase family)
MVKSIGSKEIIKALEHEGFVFVRQNGTSHSIYRHPDGRQTVVKHPAKDIPIGTVKAIERQTRVRLR